MTTHLQETARVVDPTPWLADPKIRAAYTLATLQYDVAAFLVDARTRAHRTQADVAAQAGMSQRALARLERGETNARLGSIAALVAALGYTCRLMCQVLPPLGRST